MPEERMNGTFDEIEIEDIQSEKEDAEVGPPEYEIVSFPADYTLEVLYEKIKKEEIRIPKFQRKFVWTQTQSSKLIESFMLGLPVPELFLYKEKETQYDLVVDGQQRLKSIIYFFEGIWKDANDREVVFKLKGLAEGSRWNNKTFKDFSEADQRKLKSCVLRAIVVKQLEPSDKTSIYHIFERLNTGGTKLTPQEVRNCVYEGRFNDLLVRLNRETKTWREILGKPKPDKRQRDVELMLRFFSLLHAEYKKPMKDFLSIYMKSNQNPSSDFLVKHEDIFVKTSEAILNSFGAKPFHLKAGLNAAVFDAVFVAFARHLESIPENIQTKYKNLIEDSEFADTISQSTTNVKTVETRIKKAEAILFG